MVWEQAADADLVTSAVDGDRAAFAAIYDRYVDRIHTMCVHMLSNRDDAAEVCGDVFLTAAERLHQLRDPDRLKPWLFAIARRQVYLRTTRRSRTVPTAEAADMDAPQVGQHGSLVEDAAEQSELASIVAAAAAGLDESDRLVLELQLQGLEGADLADALGVSATNAYQATHRMKERFERSIGALLVARQGRADCDDLADVLREWDGTYSVLWRKRVARHVDRCEICERRRKRVSAMLLDGVAGASEIVPAPIALRTRVLDGIALGAATVRPWPGTGFPPPERSNRRAALIVAAVVVSLLALLFGASVLGRSDGERLDTRPAGATTTSAPSTTPPATSAPVPVDTAPVDTVPADVPAPADGQSGDDPVPTTAAAPRTGSSGRAGGGGSAPGSAPPVTAPPETAPPQTSPPQTAPPQTAPPPTAPPQTAPPPTAPPLEIGERPRPLPL